MPGTRPLDKLGNASMSPPVPRTGPDSHEARPRTTNWASPGLPKVCWTAAAAPLPARPTRPRAYNAPSGASYDLARWKLLYVHCTPDTCPVDPTRLHNDSPTPECASGRCPLEASKNKRLAQPRTPPSPRFGHARARLRHASPDRNRTPSKSSTQTRSGPDSDTRGLTLAAWTSPTRYPVPDSDASYAFQSPTQTCSGPASDTRDHTSAA